MEQATNVKGLPRLSVSLWHLEFVVFIDWVWNLSANIFKIGSSGLGLIICLLSPYSFMAGVVSKYQVNRLMHDEDL